jgi:membrane AbrB-like protein
VLEIPSVIISLLAGVAGGLLSRRLALPGGPMFGALFATAAAHLALGSLDPLSPAFRTAAQILLGAVIGTALTRSPWRALREIGRPVLLTLAVLIGTALAAGFALAAVSELGLLTALFSAAPGSASDMAAAALHFDDADVPLIAAFHTVRQIVVFVILVGLFARLFGKEQRAPA